MRRSEKNFCTKEVLFAGGRSCTVQYAADLRKGCGHSAYHSAPSVARVSHRFYEKAGFYKIAKNQLPISYIYPDRDSILY